MGSGRLKLWHFLSEEALEKKRAHAVANGGELLLHPPAPRGNITKGVLQHFIYCLRYAVGGIHFLGRTSRPRLIRIDLKPETRVFRFIGDPSQIDWRGTMDKYDVIDMVVDACPAWPIRFRQSLLLHSSAVVHWSDNVAEIKMEFLSDIEALRQGTIPASEYFYTDFTQEEQLSAAMVLARILEFVPHNDTEHEKDMTNVRLALERVGARRV